VVYYTDVRGVDVHEAKACVSSRAQCQCILLL